MDTAVEHCAKRIGIWHRASTDQGHEPDVVMACAGDIPTKEALAATVMLRDAFNWIAVGRDLIGDGGAPKRRRS